MSYSRADRLALSADDFCFNGPLGSAGARIEQLAPERFRITLGAAPGNPQWPNKLNFRIIRHARGLAPVLEVVFEGGPQMAFNEYPQAWSYDGVHWTPLAWERGYRTSPQQDVLRLPCLEEDAVHVGTQTPLSHPQLMEKVRRWGRSPHGHIHVLGSSMGGRELVRLEITGAASPYPRARRWAHYVSLQHPGEFNAQWRIVGMIDWLLSDEPAAADARERHIFHFVPTMSPDGPEHGWYRVSASGQDMNRTFLAGGSDPARQPPEAYLCQCDFEGLMRSDAPIVTSWSMHTWQGIVEPILIPGPEFGGAVGSLEAFRDGLMRQDRDGLIKPLAWRSGPRQPGLGSWGGGPFEQFGITTILCEGGSHFDQQQNLRSGATLARSLCEHYAGLAPRHAS